MSNCVTHHYACDCREEKFKEMENKLKEAMSIIEELKASNDFYADRNNKNCELWDDEGCDFYGLGLGKTDAELLPLGTDSCELIQGKLARKTKQSTDQRIEKLKRK